MKRKGINFTESTKDRQNRYFSEDFKKKKVREMEKGLVTVAEVSRTYQVSRTAIYRWINKFSSMAKKNERVVVESKSDTKKIQALQEKIKELERMVGQKQMAIEFYEKMIEIGEEKYGLELKKNSDSTPLTGSAKTKKK